MRHIDAEAFIENIRKFLPTIHQSYLAEVVMRIVKEVIDKQPTIEAKPVVHAHWIKGNDGKYYCHNCGYPVEGNITEYAEWCPVCGAKMDELVSNTDELNSSVKIPVISMEDVTKIMEEGENEKQSFCFE